MEEILIDTDVIIDYLRGYNLRIKSLFSNIEQRALKGYVSSVSIVELYAGKMGNGKHEQTIFTLLSYLEILPLTASIGKLAGNMKREYQLSLADSIIAASAIEKNIPLYSFNTKHFKSIDTLRLFSF